MRVIKCSGEGPKARLDPADLRDVADVLSRGKLVVYPTDTLYALGADPYDAAAVHALYVLKGKPEGEPVSVMVADVNSIAGVARFHPAAKALAEKHLPGPLTLVLPPGPSCPKAPVASKTGIGVRVPDHPVAMAVARRYGVVTCTSANRHGEEPPRDIYEVISQLGDAVEAYVDAGSCPVGMESTVVDFTGGHGRVLREGVLSAEELGLDES
jgi:L-threonylcarbamoyladenylate synthase